MSDAAKVTIELDDLMQLCNERRSYQAEAERGENHLVSAENALIEYEIGYLQRKNRKLKKKLKKAKEYAEHMEGVVMFGQEFEGIKCTFEPENEADVILRGDASDFPEFIFSCDDGDHSFWLGANG